MTQIAHAFRVDFHYCEVMPFFQQELCQNSHAGADFYYRQAYEPVEGVGYPPGNPEVGQKMLA